MASKEGDYCIGSEVAERSAERIKALLTKGNFGSAHRVIDELERSLQYVPLTDLVDLPVAQLDLPERVVCALARNGMVYVGNLMGKREEDLRSIVGVGPKAVNEIRQSLQREVRIRGG